jgi:hypothetical protein
LGTRPALDRFPQPQRSSVQRLLCDCPVLRALWLRTESSSDQLKPPPVNRDLDECLELQSLALVISSSLSLPPSRLRLQWLSLCFKPTRRTAFRSASSRQLLLPRVRNSSGSNRRLWRWRRKSPISSPGFASFLCSGVSCGSQSRADQGGGVAQAQCAYAGSNQTKSIAKQRLNERHAL